MAVAAARQVGPGASFAYRGLREWLEAVEGLGQLRHVAGADAEEEIGAATDVLQHATDSPAALFAEVPGYDPDYRVLVNSFGSTDRIALTLGFPVGLSKVEVSEAWRRTIRGVVPLAPEVVADGPVLENVRRGADADVTIFPTPKWHPLDGGRYIGTGSFDITRDPDEGWVNLGTYRVMIHDARRLAFYISPGKHGRLQREKYFDRGERCPVAIVFGGDPLLFLAACTEIPYGVGEYDWVGGIRGEPLQVVEGPVTGLPIPADAEIVVEGFVSADTLLPEGPFGEWTGYYASGGRDEPVVEVEALYFRDAPILVGSPPARPPDEQSRFRAVVRSALLRDELEKAGIPDVVAAWQHEAGGSRLFTVVSIKQSYPGHARQVLHVAAQCRAGAYAGRYTVVVDDDIDPSDLDEVLWALCTRSDPATSIDLINRAWSTPLDPRIPPDRRAANDYTNSRALIDATRPWEWLDQYPAVNALPREARAAAKERWGHLLA